MFLSLYQQNNRDMRYFPYMVAMSHLSDAQEIIANAGWHEDWEKKSNRHINFAKWILGRYLDKMDQPFDADAEWKEFINKGY